MTNDDTRDTGIPTRAIHEAYLSLQQAHRDYMRARTEPNGNEQAAQASFQEAVLTFYELIRPHLKRQSGLQQFWAGELPDYPSQPFQSVDRARAYCSEYGTAIWSLQKHVGTAPQAQAGGSDAAAVADGGNSLAEWHDQFGLTDRQFLVSVQSDDSGLVYIEFRAVMGLKQLDTWDTSERRERGQAGGFMAGETTEQTVLEYVAPEKLTKAKRLLAEAADKMNLLSRVEVDHDDGAIVNFDQSREDAQAEYRDAEYDSSPDI